MVDLLKLMSACDGLAPTWRLVELGASRSAIAWAAGHNVIRRVRSGWYCLPDTPLLQQQAARVGGRLTEMSAAAAAGVWVVRESTLHVALPPNACRPRERDHYRRRLSARSELPVDLYWNDHRTDGTPFVVAVEDWLTEITARRPLPIAAAVADSALRLGVIDPISWEQVRAALPLWRSSALALVDGIPESGTETMVLTALHMAGISARPQVWITDAIRVDLLVGDRLVIEVFSQEHHGSREQRIRDLERIAILTRLGYRVLVFDYAQVLGDLDTVVATVAAVIAELGHLALR